MPRGERLTQARLKELLHYDPGTGEFTWLVTHVSSQHLVGTRAGCIKDKDGYRIIWVDHNRYYEHRLAWLYMTGEWPKQIDHRDTDKANNRWINLRLANKSLNGANRKPPRSNTSGFKGVSLDTRDNRWQAYIGHKGKRHSLGYYITREEAAAAYAAKAAELFGEFARIS